MNYGKEAPFRHVPGRNLFSNLLPASSSVDAKATKKFQMFPGFPATNAGALFGILLLCFLLLSLFFANGFGFGLVFVFVIASRIFVATTAVLRHVVVVAAVFEQFAKLARCRSCGSSSRGRQEWIRVEIYALLVVLGLQSCERASKLNRRPKIHFGRR